MYCRSCHPPPTRTRFWRHETIKHIILLSIFCPQRRDIFTHPVNGERTQTSRLSLPVKGFFWGILQLLPEPYEFHGNLSLLFFSNADINKCHQSGCFPFPLRQKCVAEFSNAGRVRVRGCSDSGWPSHSACAGAHTWRAWVAPRSRDGAPRFSLAPSGHKKYSTRVFFERKDVDFWSCYCWKPIWYNDFSEIQPSSEHFLLCIANTADGLIFFSFLF